MGQWKTDLSSIVEGISLLECKLTLTSLLSAYKEIPMPVHGAFMLTQVKHTEHVEEGPPHECITSSCSTGLKAPDAAKRVKWTEDFLMHAVMMAFTYPDYILWTDEAIIHLNSTVSTGTMPSPGPPRTPMSISLRKKLG